MNCRFFVFQLFPFMRSGGWQRLCIGLAGLLCILLFSAPGSCESARDIVSKANDLIHGKSSTATAVMTVVKTDWSTRTILRHAFATKPDWSAFN